MGLASNHGQLFFLYNTTYLGILYEKLSFEFSCKHKKNGAGTIPVLPMQIRKAKKKKKKVLTEVETVTHVYEY